MQRRQQAKANNGKSRGNHSCGSIAGRGFGGPDGMSARLETEGLQYKISLSLSLSA